MSFFYLFIYFFFEPMLILVKIFMLFAHFQYDLYLKYQNWNRNFDSPSKKKKNSNCFNFWYFIYQIKTPKHEPDDVIQLTYTDTHIVAENLIILFFFFSTKQNFSRTFINIIFIFDRNLFNSINQKLLFYFCWFYLQIINSYHSSAFFFFCSH